MAEAWRTGLERPFVLHRQDVHGHHHLLDTAQAPVYGGENLASVAVEHMTDLESAFHQIGYVCQAKVLDSAKYDSPQTAGRGFHHGH